MRGSHAFQHTIPFQNIPPSRTSQRTANAMPCHALHCIALHQAHKRENKKRNSFLLLTDDSSTCVFSTSTLRPRPRPLHACSLFSHAMQVSDLHYKSRCHKVRASLAGYSHEATMHMPRCAMLCHAMPCNAMPMDFRVVESGVYVRCVCVVQPTSTESSSQKRHQQVFHQKRSPMAVPWLSP